MWCDEMCVAAAYKQPLTLPLSLSPASSAAFHLEAEVPTCVSNPAAGQSQSAGSDHFKGSDTHTHTHTHGEMKRVSLLLLLWGGGALFVSIKHQRAARLLLFPPFVFCRFSFGCRVGDLWPLASRPPRAAGDSFWLEDVKIICFYYLLFCFIIYFCIYFFYILFVWWNLLL